MTIRELIKELSNIDDDLLDSQVWIKSHIPLSKNVSLSTRTELKYIPENLDVDNERIYLETS